MYIKYIKYSHAEKLQSYNFNNTKSKFQREVYKYIIE